MNPEIAAQVYRDLRDPNLGKQMRAEETIRASIGERDFRWSRERDGRTDAEFNEDRRREDAADDAAHAAWLEREASYTPDPYGPVDSVHSDGLWG